MVATSAAPLPLSLPLLSLKSSRPVRRQPSRGTKPLPMPGNHGRPPRCQGAVPPPPAPLPSPKRCGRRPPSALPRRRRVRRTSCATLTSQTHRRGKQCPRTYLAQMTLGQQARTPSAPHPLPPTPSPSCLPPRTPLPPCRAPPSVPLPPPPPQPTPLVPRRQPLPTATPLALQQQRTPLPGRLISLAGPCNSNSSSSQRQCLGRPQTRLPGPGRLLLLPKPLRCCSPSNRRPQGTSPSPPQLSGSPPLPPHPPTPL
mmetsp:Transcript_17629/g.49276  ORF Transcript_17629/g.49276 Transcript_17629/m.49276 type:complete len:256 (-) Transcript_17629:598-1365(-)